MRQVKIPGPLAPSKVEINSINRMLVEAGVALPIKELSLIYFDIPFHMLLYFNHNTIYLPILILTVILDSMQQLLLQGGFSSHYGI